MNYKKVRYLRQSAGHNFRDVPRVTGSQTDVEHYEDNRLEANSELGKMVKSRIVDDSLDDQQESSIQVDESRSEQTLSEFSNERKPVVISLKRSGNKDTEVRGGTSLVTCNICGPHRVMKKYHLREAIRVE